MKKIIFSLSVVISSIYASDNVLLEQAKEHFKPLSQTFLSTTYTLTQAKTRLGKILFNEKRVSIDGTTSCAKCHPFSYYGSDNLEKSRGNLGNQITR